MGIFGKMMESLAAGTADRMAKNAGRSAARAMMLAALTMKHHYGAAAPSYAFLARKALSTRPYWKQVGEKHFQYERSGSYMVWSSVNTIE